MTRDTKRPAAGTVGFDSTSFQSLLVFRDRQTGLLRARFSSYLTLKAAKADLAAKGRRETPLCLFQLHNHPRLVDLLQRTNGVISREIGEMENLFANVFVVAFQLGEYREHKRNEESGKDADIAVEVVDDTDGGGQ
jgi:hypothetical protein